MIYKGVLKEGQKVLTHHLAGGVIVLKENGVLLVRDKYGWSMQIKAKITLHNSI